MDPKNKLILERGTWQVPQGNAWAIFNTRLKAYAATDIDWKHQLGNTTLYFPSEREARDFVAEYSWGFDIREIEFKDTGIRFRHIMEMNQEAASEE